MVARLYLTAVLACTAIGLFFAAPAQAEDAVAVVTHPDSPIDTLSRDQAAGLFLGERPMSSDGRPIVPIDLDNEAVRAAFYARAANRSLMQIRAYWARMVFTGNGRPPKSLPLETILQRLSTDTRVITYMPASAATGLKVLLLLPTPQP